MAKHGIRESMPSPKKPKAKKPTLPLKPRGNKNSGKKKG